MKLRLSNRGLIGTVLACLEMSFRRQPVFYRTIFRDAVMLGEATLVQLERMHTNFILRGLGAIRPKAMEIIRPST